MTESIEELVAANRRLEKILTSEVRDRLLAIPGVIHVSTGLKEVGGQAIDELCVKTYVEHKRPLAELDEPVPETVSGVRTDVTEIPEIEFSTDETKHRPLVGGIQITNGIKGLNADLTIELNRGTLGCFATRKADKKGVLLTNWHVASAHGGGVRRRLFQPLPELGPDKLEDDFPKHPKSSANAVAEIVDLRVTEKVDGAIAKVKTCYSCCCNCGIGFRNVIRGLAANGTAAAVAGTAPVVGGQKVLKVGKKSDRTEGRVVTTSFGPFTIKREGTEYTFTGQIQIEGTGGRPFAVSGDSGSVVVDESHRVVGLYFASPTNNAFALANHIGDVMTELKITITGREESLVGDRAADGDELLAALSTRLTASEQGTRLFERIEAHQAEIVTLVNHERRVTVVWHRIEGPSWLAALTRSAREPDYRIPAEIAGVTRADALTRMREVLTRYGSADLRADLDRYFDELLAAFTSHHTVDELLGAWRTDVQIA